jgi:tRNA pseudouridine13 synthase
MRFSLDFPWAQAQPQATAVFRATVDDFQVVEELGFEPSGVGEHVLLHIRKRGENTQWVADRIADFAGVKKQDVGFCGLKDRWAITTQWFSVYLPKGPEPDWQAFVQSSEANIELLAVARHQQKLRRGAHQRNFFVIRLTELEADQDLPNRLATIREQGVPNYFGEQRFGREGNNLQMAADWLEQGKRVKSRSLRGLVTSAARSWLFNQVLAHRVEQGNWNRSIDGDVLSSDGLPQGPLWGRGRSAAQGEAALIEQQVLQPWQSWTEGLEHCGLQQERRPLALMPEAFSWQQDEDSLIVQFGLLPGQFATAVLREIAQLRTAQTVLA